MEVPAKYFDAGEIVGLFEALVDFGDSEVKEEIEDLLSKARRSHARMKKVRLALVP